MTVIYSTSYKALSARITEKGMIELTVEEANHETKQLSFPKEAIPKLIEFLKVN